MTTSEMLNISDVFDRYWSDDSFRENFLRDPASILDEHGMMNIRGMEMEIVDHKENMIHLIFHSEAPDKIHLVSHRHPRPSDRGG
ncbi:MAG: hypothetical protein CMJ36_04975 [Phycisphaerae bacterium]|nr:hypothetical protein [Phycisphaerae bacterium]|tara:strand:- start:422 stop:676 length:255 start_codon:yes stop_codon:yes gene_type:complete